MTSVVARRLGEPGFVTFLSALVELGVLSPAEKRRWLALPGAVVRTEPPLDDGERFDEEELRALAHELGAQFPPEGTA